MKFTTREKKKILNSEKSGLERNIARELLKETRLRRKWGIFFKSLFFAYLLAILLVWFPYSSDISLGEKESATGVVRLEGVIGTTGGVDVQDVIGDLRRAFEDERTRAVILSINSPGGSPVQSSNLNSEIWELRSDFPEKALYAVIQDICASGGYFVASAATRIFANESSLVGSIGVRFDSFGFVESLKKIGIERRLLTAGEHKGMLDPFLPTNEEQMDHISQLLEEIHDHFILAVKKGREKKIKNPDNVFSGLIWTGTQSIEIGLVDDLGSIESVAREVVKAEKIINFTREKFPWEGNLGVRLKNMMVGWSNFLIW